MTETKFEKDLTALLIVDPFNDFISDGGKLWPSAKAVAEANNCVGNMRDVLKAAREAGITVFFVPHHRWRPGDYSRWKYISPNQKRADDLRLFEAGTWRGEFHPDFQPGPQDVVVQEHWSSSGFANTDLDLQLKKYGLHKLIIMGLRANTCIESTVRFAAEFGYHVTLVEDAIAAYSWGEMNATLKLNAPNYANAILPAQEVLARISNG